MLYTPYEALKQIDGAKLVGRALHIYQTAYIVLIVNLKGQLSPIKPENDEFFINLFRRIYVKDCGRGTQKNKDSI